MCLQLPNPIFLLVPFTDAGDHRPRCSGQKPGGESTSFFPLSCKNFLNMFQICSDHLSVSSAISQVERLLHLAWPITMPPNKNVPKFTPSLHPH